MREAELANAEERHVEAIKRASDSLAALEAEHQETVRRLQAQLDARAQSSTPSSHGRQSSEELVSVRLLRGIKLMAVQTALHHAHNAKLNETAMKLEAVQEENNRLKMEIRFHEQNQQ